MLNRLSLSEILKNEGDYYAFIVGASKIARKIVEEENQLRNVCPDNPVDDAIKGILKGDYEFSNLELIKKKRSEP